MRMDEILKCAWFTPGLNGSWGLVLKIEGEPGTAKSRKLERLARQCSLRPETVIASLREPTDFGGLAIPREIKPADRKRFAREKIGDAELSAVVTPDGGLDVVVYYAPANWALNLHAAKHGLCFLDEVNTAPPAVQAALLRVVLDRVVGDLQLPPTVRFVAAMNSTDDSAGGWDLAPPLANRFGHMTWAGPDAESWCDWLLGADDEDDEKEDAVELEKRVMLAWPSPWANARGLVAGFIHRFPDLLHKKPAAGSPDLSRAWPSRRCYTSDTDVLTKRGWVAWPNVDPQTDEFATRAPDGAVSYVKAIKHVRAFYEGPMVRFKSKLIDLTVTPNHNMYVAKTAMGGEPGKGRHRQEEEYGFVTAQEVFDDVHSRPSFAVRIPKTGNWDSSNMPILKISGMESGIPAEDFAELIGWILTDGYISRAEKAGSTIVSVTQVDPAQRERIRTLFERCGFHTYLAADRVGTVNRMLWGYLKNQGRKHDGNRFVPREIMESGPIVLNRLLAGAFGGDGWIKHDGGVCINVGLSERLAGDLQEAHIRLGGVASITTSYGKSTGRKFFQANLYRDGGKHRATKLSAKNITQTFYKGEVHCVEVPPHSTLYVRQNGHACWSGNTWEMATRALAGAEVHNLTDAETEVLMSAFIGEGTASQFYKWREDMDLPDPAEVLDGKVKFKHEPKRLDRTMATLSACAALVTPPNAEKRSGRAAKLWGILGEVCKDAADIAIPPARALSKARLLASKEAQDVLNKQLYDVLKAAGIIQ